MAIDAESTWKADWANIPKVSDTSWKANLANFIDAKLTNKLSTNGLFSAPEAGAMTFTFGKAAFQGALTDNTPATIATAIESGILASIPVVAPGAFIGVDSPATKFSVVTTATITPASVALAKAKILEVISLPAVADASQSGFPGNLRDAFLLLKLTTIGLDTTPSPSGPLPLTDAERAVA